MNEDRAALKRLAPWGFAMIIFFAIALVCVGFIFAPVEEHMLTGGISNGEIIIGHSPLSVIGGKLMGESWKIYPQYTLGLGISGIMSFSGGLFCIVVICNKQKGVG